MSEENKKPEENIVEEAKATEAKIDETPTENKAPKPYLEKAPSKPEAKDDANAEGGRGQRRGPGGKKGAPGGGGSHGGKRRSRAEQQEQPSEYIEKVVQVRRVTKVCKGGKKLSFRTTVIIGNEKGKVGVGVGKAAEVLIAIKKAIAKNVSVSLQTLCATDAIYFSYL